MSCFERCDGVRPDHEMRRAMKSRLWMALLAFCVCPASVAGEGPDGAFAFVSPQLILTAEVAGPHGFVLNLVNLSDFVMVVQPNELIYKAASGRYYIGQVYDKPAKDNRGQTFRYSASVLLSSRSFTGLTVLGDFQEMDRIVELSLRIGSKRHYLQAFTRQEFEIVAAKIGEVDLEQADSRVALDGANLQAIGTVRSTDGTSEWDRDWEGLIRYDGVILPKILEKPAVAPTDEAVRTKTYGRVRLSAIITKDGGLMDFRVEKGLGRGLDERALEAVRNSWVFLPATKNGEVLEGRLDFYVDFPPPAPPPDP